MSDPNQRSPDPSLADLRTASATPRRSPPIIPDHELMRLIGRGSYGEVWLARSALGSWRAVKVVYRESFDHDKPYLREFEGLRSFEPISHARESQIDIFHVGRNEEAGYFYYIMELADPALSERQQAESRPATDIRSPAAEESQARSPESTIDQGPPAWAGDYAPRTLKHELRTWGARPVAQCVQIALSLTRALEHLHSHGLVHRDIKPSNIIFVKGVPKLADIGLVTSVDATRSFVGTDGYIPPEGPGTPQADLYSLGKVLYECATGKDRLDFPELPADWRIRPDFERLVEFNEVLTKACDDEPNLRYQSAEEMRVELGQLGEGLSLRSKRVLGQRLKALKRIAQAAGVVVVVLLVLYLVSHIGSGPLHQAKANLSQNEEAQRLYELARWHFNRTPGTVSQTATDAIERAIQLDPKFVAAHVLRLEMTIWSFDLPRHDLAVKTGEIADKLMAMDATLGEGHAARGWSEYCQFNWEVGKKELHEAIRLSLNYAMGQCLYALILNTDGKCDESRSYYQRALELEPTSRMMTVAAGFPDFYSRHYTNAIIQFEKALELEPNCGYALGFIAKAYETAGDYREAIKTFEKAAISGGEDPAKVKLRCDEWRAALDANGAYGYWENRLRLASAETNTDLEDRALVAAHLGRTSEALECLERAFDSLAYTAFWLKTDPNWDSLRKEPRFQALLRRARFPD